ncbi:pimeloyl-ACP methyl ester carboxylesterase [Dokdonella fugitiva]|uniref:Pimeloyl-ACP methyl ester carboxylesterase n=1 Tax=Dokdonella fugitiva TaxID=328517 RepID=A0A839ESK9_9GAMM|nr:alpha/beta hydrolase [Dokdonella fugitiva]MBA8886745.1 pimeloyl-ACP methyl ester carboxylesterase [Dokdonella fugitiva]
MATLVAARNSTIVRNIRFALLRAGFAFGSWLRPAATLRRAYRLFCTPLSVTRRRALATDTGGAALGSLAIGGEQVSLYTWGDPSAQPYVLLSHGWSSHATRFLPWIAPLREAGYAVVGFDQVGHGRSSGRRATLPDFAAVLAEIARRHGPSAAVIGHSLGGAATMLALADGLATGRAILIAPAADPIDAASRFGRFVGLNDYLTRHLFDEYEAKHPLRVATLQAHLKAPAIARPALIVHDLDDREVPWAEGERYARHWPGARLLTTTGLGHNRIADDRAVIDHALCFLRGEAIGERVVSSPNLPYGFA